MKSEIELNHCGSLIDEGFKGFKLEESDLKQGIKIGFISDGLHDFLISSNNDEEAGATIFSLNIKCGDKEIGSDVEINELELFAHSILKQIEIVRKNYGEEIKIQAGKTEFV